jgi:hypothetical protein
MVVWIVASGDELVVILDNAVDLRVQYKFTAEDRDGVRAALLAEGCVERQIREAMATVEIGKAASIKIDSHR